MTRKSRILAAASAGLFFCFAARGSQSVSLAWSPITSPVPAGYFLHLGTVSHTYPSVINVGTNTVVTLSGLASGQTYYFAVGGYNSSGMEGARSAETSFVATTNVVSVPAFGGSVMVTPASGAVGTEVDIYGVNLSGVTSVSFAGVYAAYNVISNAYLAAIVPAGAVTGLLNITTTAGTISGQFTVNPTIGPANDNFANAQALTGTNVFVWANTTGATRQTGEPNDGGNGGGASVWYRWTAPETATFSIDTAGTQFLPLLAVYTGTSISQLSVVASNANTGGGTLSFQASKGVTYNISVDGFNGMAGQMQLRLSPQVSSAMVFYDTFDEAGIIGLSPLAGQNGWVCSQPALSGVAVNYFTGLEQQGFLGLADLLLTATNVLLYHPLNYAVDTNTRPIIQFDVTFELNNSGNLYRNSFGWVFRNTAGQQLFSIVFNDYTGQITYGLDDGVGQRPSGSILNANTMAELVVTADFSRNQWGASLNGTPIFAGQPITTAHAALTLGDIDAEAIYPGLQSGLDGMVFDDYIVTASPEPAPKILLGPQNQTVSAGSDLVLDAIATGVLPISYQWYFNGVAIPGATSAGLWLKNATPAEAGQYQVVAVNANGTASASCTVAVSSPQPKAQLALPISLTAGTRMVNFNVANGHSYRVQASTNLTTWSALGSFYANGTNAIYFDATAASFPTRYYRLASP